MGRTAAVVSSAGIDYGRDADDRAVPMVTPALRAAARQRFGQNHGVTVAGRHRSRSRSPRAARVMSVNSRVDGRFGTVDADDHNSRASGTPHSQLHEWDGRRFGGAKQRPRRHNDDDHHHDHHLHHHRNRPQQDQSDQHPRRTGAYVRATLDLQQQRGVAAENDTRNQGVSVGSGDDKNSTLQPQLKTPGPERRPHRGRNHSSIHDMDREEFNANERNQNVLPVRDAETDDDDSDNDSGDDDASKLLKELAQRWSGGVDMPALTHETTGRQQQDGGSGAGAVWTEQWDNATLGSRDAPGEQLLERLVGQLRHSFATSASRQEGPLPPLFKDEHFPAGDVSLYKAGRRPGSDAKGNDYLWSVRESAGEISWKRPYEIYGYTDGKTAPNSVVVVPAFSGGIEPDDVEQREAAGQQASVGGSNYFLAALQAVAEQQQLSAAASGADPYVEEDVLVKDLLVESGADIGIFGVKFWLHGRWRTLVIDDRFPCVRNNDNGTWEPVFSGRAPRREFELVSTI